MIKTYMNQHPSGEVIEALRIYHNVVDREELIAGIEFLKKRFPEYLFQGVEATLNEVIVERQKKYDDCIASVVQARLQNPRESFSAENARDSALRALKAAERLR